MHRTRHYWKHSALSGLLRLLEVPSNQLGPLTNANMKPEFGQWHRRKTLILNPTIHSLQTFSFLKNYASISILYLLTLQQKPLAFNPSISLEEFSITIHNACLGSDDIHWTLLKNLLPISVAYLLSLFSVIYTKIYTLPLGKLSYRVTTYGIVLEKSGVLMQHTVYLQIVVQYAVHLKEEALYSS